MKLTVARRNNNILFQLNAMAKKKVSELHRLVLDNVPYLVWFKDNNGKYLHVNRAFADSYRKKTEEIIGKSDFDLCSYEKAVEFHNSDEEVKLHKKRQFFEQIETLFDSDTTFETYKTPVLDENENVIGIAGIAREITDNTQMEKTLHEREEQLR